MRSYTCCWMDHSVGRSGASINGVAVRAPVSRRDHLGPPDDDDELLNSGVSTTSSERKRHSANTSAFAFGARAAPPTGYDFIDMPSANAAQDARAVPEKVSWRESFMEQGLNKDEKMPPPAKE